MEGNSLGQTIVGLVTAALMYSAIGFVAGFIYLGVAPALGLPAVGILPLMGLWWLWLLVFAPPVVFFVSTFRATDPQKHLVDAVKNANKEQSTNL